MSTLRPLLRTTGLCVLLLTGACDDGAEAERLDLAPDLGLADTGAPDLGSPDAGSADLGASDTGAPDLGTPDAGPPLCNGAAALCARRYDQVAYATAHNAMSSTEAGFRPPNNKFAIPQQLADGVRAFMLDTYEQDGELLLCHAECSLGNSPLVDTLAVFAEWLEANPTDVLTLIFEAYISGEQTATAFAEAGLLDAVWTQTEGAPWPTLEEMITANRRLVVFSDRRGGPEWHHFMWDYAWETAFSYPSVEAFDCAPNRGDPNNALFILNHFITAPIAQLRYAEEANQNPLFETRALDCLQRSGQLPNFVTVDFYSVGALFDVVDTLNELSL